MLEPPLELARAGAGRKKAVRIPQPVRTEKGNVRELKRFVETQHRRECGGELGVLRVEKAQTSGGGRQAGKIKGFFWEGAALNDLQSAQKEPFHVCRERRTVCEWQRTEMIQLRNPNKN